MILKTLIPVDHGILFVSDDMDAEFADPDDRVQPIHATSTGITVATLHGQEGDVGIVVTDEAGCQDFEALKQVAAYSIASPRKTLSIFNTSCIEVMRWSVPETQTKLEVWLDDVREAAIVGLFIRAERPA